MEDYFQVGAFEHTIARDAWEQWPCRVEANVERILALFAQHDIRASRDTLVGRTALTKAVVHIEDALADPEYRWKEAQRLGGHRTMLGVPIVRDDTVIGVVALWKERVEPFTPAQIQLVATFASQAAIAIQNASLFSETREALERQTATAEILRVIASSPSDEQPVFDAIVAHAGRMAGGCSVNVSRLIGDELHQCIPGSRIRGIPLHDHVVLGGSEYRSMAELGILEEMGDVEAERGTEVGRNRYFH